MFSRKPKPSRPPETFTPQRIEFLGEQTGPPEHRLKTKFCQVFEGTSTVRSAYLARLTFGDSSEWSVGLCIRSTIGVDRTLQKRLGEVFAEVFASNQFLDILFIRDDQEQELQKVCKAFYVAPISAQDPAASKS